MAPRLRRGATPRRPSAAQYRRIAAALKRVTTIVERNASDIVDLRFELRIQFKRLAQLQAELDAHKKDFEKLAAV